MYMYKHTLFCKQNKAPDLQVLVTRQPEFTQLMHICILTRDDYRIFRVFRREEVFKFLSSELSSIPSVKWLFIIPVEQNQQPGGKGGSNRWECSPTSDTSL